MRLPVQMLLNAKGLPSNLEVPKIDAGAEADLGPLIRKAIPLLRLDAPLQRLGHPLRINRSGGADRKDRLRNEKVQLRVRGPSLKPLDAGLMTTGGFDPVRNVLDCKGCLCLLCLLQGHGRRGRAIEAVGPIARLRGKCLCNCTKTTEK